MTMKRLLLCLALVLLASSASAVDWWPTGDNSYLDMDSIRKLNNGNITYWVKGTSQKMQQENPQFAYSLIRAEINCDREEVRIQSWVAYNHDGGVIGRDRGEDRFLPIAPGTVAGNVYDVTCKPPIRK